MIVRQAVVGLLLFAGTGVALLAFGVPEVGAVAIALVAGAAGWVFTRDDRDR